MWWCSHHTTFVMAIEVGNTNLLTHDMAVKDLWYKIFLCFNLYISIVFENFCDSKRQIAALFNFFSAHINLFVKHYSCLEMGNKKCNILSISLEIL